MRLLPAFALLLVAVAATAQPADRGLQPFASDSALAAYVDDLRERWRPAPRPAPRPATDSSPSPAEGSCGGEGDAVVTGRVTDADTGDPLPGAHVMVDTTEPCGVAADVDGRFRIALGDDALADSAVVIEARYTGYGPGVVAATLAPGDSAAVELGLSVDGSALEEVVVSGAAPAQADAVAGVSVTNVQTAGVDEGGIVKLHRGHLVVLRRGRLFTVDVADGALAPVDWADASGPEVDGRGTWYDELLIVGETAVVVGYSYARGGTELVLFDLGPDGAITYRSTYHLRSNDYYSAANYASRVVDGRLVFYTPLRMDWWGDGGPDAWLPALRRWAGDAAGRFEPLATATHVYRPAREPRRYGLALHTVTSCAVADGALDCEATAVMGPFGHTFYVSGSAVYVWLSGWAPHAGAAPATVYRLPLDGGAPTAVGVEGSPIDQFSFLQADGALQVVVGPWGGGQWMWRSERPRDDLALVRIPLDAFGDGAADVPREAYARLPVGEGGADVNRFVGGHLLYGASYRGDRVHVVDWRAPGAVRALVTGHATERIEVMGRHAVVVGADGGDHRFSAVRLGASPRVADGVRLRNAAQGETRSHGFFYRSDGDERGVIGLPVRRAGGRYASLRAGSASVVYLGNRGLRLRRYGALDASPGPVDDGCVASCVDWYGNARPLFVGDRVFALLGYEIVEGRLAAGRVREVGRASFAPDPPLASR